jgi:hypothetical protein
LADCGFTAEQNLGLIARHEKEHDAGDAFACAVLGELLTWVDDWGAAPVVLRALPEETGAVAAIAGHGLHEIPAHHQQLPYRWFRRTAAVDSSDMVR